MFIEIWVLIAAVIAAVILGVVMFIAGVTYRKKSGEKQINIRPLALAVSAEENRIRARLMLTEKDALKADLLVKTLAERAGVELCDVRIHRETLLGKDANGELKPLLEL